MSLRTTAQLTEGDVNLNQIIFQEIYIAMVTTMTVIGNGVIVTLCTVNNALLSKGSTFLVFVLCMDYFILGAGNMLWISVSLVTGNWLGGSNGVWCHISAVLPTYVVHVAYLLLAFISVDCSYAICRPFKYRIHMSYKNIIIGVILCVLLPVPMNLFTVLDLDAMYNRHLGQCQLVWNPYSEQHRLYILLMFVFFAIIPMLCMVVSYSLIFKEVVSRNLVVYPSRSFNLKAGLRRSVDISYNIAKMALIMITCFIVTWLPNFILSFFIMFSPDVAMRVVLLKYVSLQRVVPTWVLDVSVWMYYFSPAITPVIYTLRNHSLRNNMERVIIGPVLSAVATVTAPSIHTIERKTSSSFARTSATSIKRKVYSFKEVINLPLKPDSRRQSSVSATARGRSIIFLT